jgi:hypothetical protein
MGRYYSGDINGKFWFALQSSNAPSRFGGYEHSPSVIEYSFYEEEHLKGIEDEIKAIEDKLSDKLDVIEKFFENNNSYNDEMIKPYFTTDELRDYADLLLGREIRDCVKEFGQCNFDAEL